MKGIIKNFALLLVVLAIPALIAKKEISHHRDLVKKGFVDFEIWVPDGARVITDPESWDKMIIDPKCIFFERLDFEDYKLKLGDEKEQTVFIHPKAILYRAIIGGGKVQITTSQVISRITWGYQKVSYLGDGRIRLSTEDSLEAYVLICISSLLLGGVVDLGILFIGSAMFLVSAVVYGTCKGWLLRRR